MLQVKSPHKLEEVHLALRRAIEHRGASLHALSPIDVSSRPAVYLLLHHPVYESLLTADPRLAAYLPCHIAAWDEGGAVTVVTGSPRKLAALLDRPDLSPLLDQLENTLLEALEEASQQAASLPVHSIDVARAPGRATEEQMNMRGTVPQRIDKRGTKVEDLAGTGKHDAQGG
jgi:uncharacterized protein (DUF302 family)